jgi:hypothetical protein
MLAQSVSHPTPRLITRVHRFYHCLACGPIAPGLPSSYRRPGRRLQPLRPNLQAHSSANPVIACGHGGIPWDARGLGPLPHRIRALAKPSEIVGPTEQSLLPPLEPRCAQACRNTREIHGFPLTPGPGICWPPSSEGCGSWAI